MSYLAVKAIDSTSCTACLKLAGVDKTTIELLRRDGEAPVSYNLPMLLDY